MFFCFNLNAQTDNTNLNTQLNSLRTAFIDKDFDVVADYTYPKVVALMGGKEKMVEVSAASIAKMESQNFILKSISYEDPSEFMNIMVIHNVCLHRQLS